MTARPAARRSGISATGPPSWKISSTSADFLANLDLRHHSFSNREDIDLRQFRWRDGAPTRRVSSGDQSGCTDQTSDRSESCHRFSVVRERVALRLSSDARLLRDKPIAKVTFRRSSQAGMRRIRDVRAGRPRLQ